MPHQRDRHTTRTGQLIHGELPYEKAGVTAAGLIATGTTFYHFVEGLTWLDAFYFTTITLASIGYGDYAPETSVGKIFTIFYVFIGVSLFFVVAGITVNKFLMGSIRPDRSPPRESSYLQREKDEVE